MKKSRTGTAILFLAFLVAGFIAVALVVAILSNAGDDASIWTELVDSGNKVGIVPIEGTILSADTHLKQLRKFRKKSSVKAVVLRINSPGGAVAPAQELYREIIKVKSKKPVVASFETVAASAAYYISSGSSNIVCSRGTITGSIGVIMMLPHFQKVIEKIGVDVDVIKAGKYKDIGSSVRPLTQEERKILEEFAGEVHEQFISDVAAGRKGKIEKDKLYAIADGRFFTGEKAREMGLVDTIGNFYDAVKLAAELGGIKGEPELLFPKKSWDNYLELVMESVTQAALKITDRHGAAPSAPILR